MNNINYYKIEEEWKKEVKNSHNDFVEEFTMENPEFVKERRLEFLQRELRIQIEKNLWNLEIFLGVRKTQWFKDVIEEALLFPGMEKARKIKKEISFYENPKEFCLGESLTEDEIEKAHKADCSEFLETKKKGKNSFALCIFHSEKTPSLCCFAGGRFKCFGCGAGGDAIDLVQKLYNLNFKEAVKFINSKT